MKFRFGNDQKLPQNSCHNFLLIVFTFMICAPGNGRKWRESSNMERENGGALTPLSLLGEGESSVAAFYACVVCALSNASFLYKMETARIRGRGTKGRLEPLTIATHCGFLSGIKVPMRSVYRG